MTNGKKPIEAFALSRVPREQRKSWVDMVMVQAGMVICIPAFLLGSMLAEGMPTLQAILAGIIGYGMVLLLLIMIVGTVMAFRIYGSAGLSANEVETPTMSMIEGIGTAFSFFSASAFTAADLTRFQRNRRDTVRSAF